MKWEYKTIKLATTGFVGGLMGGKLDDTKLNNEMNQLGIQGWELVSSFSTSQSFGESRDIVLIFKKVRN